MKIIISPAKKMIDTSDSFVPSTKPCFLHDAKTIFNTIKKLNREELKTVLKCNDQLVDLNYDRYATNKLEKANMMALVTYQGLQYQEMAPHVFSDDAWQYVNEHLVILSGLYGYLKPTDAVVPYRLEMQAKIKIKNHHNLYDFWGDKIAKELLRDNDVIINLASKEYSDVIEPYCKDRMITIVFGELINDKIKIKGTLAKMARGAMVRYMAEHNITQVDDMKHFNLYGFAYSKQHSSKNEIVFIKQ